MNVDTVLRRIMEQTNTSTYYQLAVKMGIAHTTLSSWRRRNVLDTSIIMEKFPDLDFNYLFKSTEDRTEQTQVRDSSVLYKPDVEPTLKIFLDKLMEFDMRLQRVEKQ